MTWIARISIQKNRGAEREKQDSIVLLFSEGDLLTANTTSFTWKVLNKRLFQAQTAGTVRSVFTHTPGCRPPHADPVIKSL